MKRYIMKENWMENLDPVLKNVCLCYLAIPGSHDSLSYSVTRESKLAPDAPKIAKVLCKIFRKKTTQLVYNWCVTQKLELMQQFQLGVRYFDLRVAINGNEPYSCHSLYGIKITEALETLNNALNLYSKEVVILDFQHFYQFSEIDHISFIDKIHSIFGSKICPLPANIENITLNYLQNHNFQVIIVYRSKYFEKALNFWPSSEWITLWPNTTNLKKLYNYLESSLKKRPPYTGFVSQCVFTPSKIFIALHYRSSLLEKCVKSCNIGIKSLWIQKQKCLTPNGVNVIIADFVDLEDVQFCNTVINLNKQFYM